MSTEDRAILLEQLTYYRAARRSATSGSSVRVVTISGDEHRRQWFDEVATVEAALIDVCAR
jgi:hypothetical protein